MTREALPSLFYARLFASRDGRLSVEDAPHDAVRVIAGRADDFRFADLGPEEVAHLAHALNQWVAGSAFTAGVATATVATT